MFTLLEVDDACGSNVGGSPVIATVRVSLDVYKRQILSGATCFPPAVIISEDMRT